MSRRLRAIRTQRLPFAPGGPVHALWRGDRFTLVVLGEGNVDTRWIDLGADGSIDGPFALPFAMENVVGVDGALLLSGNEPGSNEAIVLTVDAAGTVTRRDHVDIGSPIRWPIPVATGSGVALLWETADGLHWQPAGEHDARRISTATSTNAVAIAAATDYATFLVARSTLGGEVEVWTPETDRWLALDLAGWLDSVAVAPFGTGWAITAARRGERTVLVSVLDAGLTPAATLVLEPPGAGPLMSSSVRSVAAGSVVLLAWSARHRTRQPGTSASSQAVTAIEVDDLANGAGADWVSLEPAGALHNAIASDGRDRVVTVHGDDDASATEFHIEP